MANPYSFGKQIITGEHSVVYGYPALVATVDLKVQVQIIEDGSNKISIRNSEQKLQKNSQKVLKLWQDANNNWEKFQETNDTSLLRTFWIVPGCLVWLSLGVVIEKFQVNLEGLELHITSDIPVGSGMGSSAAVAHAVIKAVLMFKNIEIDKEQLFKLVFQVEKIMHGNPSGIDVVAVVYEGWIKFQKMSGEFNREYLHIPRLSLNYLLINTGKPVESTGELVSLVRQNLHKNQPVLHEIGEISNKIINQLQTGSLDLELISQNQSLLEEIGVVGSRAANVVNSIKSIGGAAKVCGAGGIKQGSGMVTAFHESKEVLLNLAQDLGLPYYDVSLGIKSE